MGQILRLRSGEYEILDRGEVHRLTSAGQLGRPLDPVAATGLLQNAARDPSTMRSLRLVLARHLGPHGMQRRSDRQVVTEFTRLLQSGQFTLRPATVYPEGNAGLFIVELERTRVNNPFNPTVIAISQWQVVKTVPGTWLTAVAKYGLKPPWPSRELHRVYSDEWVQKCKPADPTRDTEPKYTFWDVYQPGGRWEKGISETPRDARPGEVRDADIEIGSYWCFKIKEVAKFMLPEMDTELLKRRKKLFDALFEQAMGAREKKRLLERLNELEKTAKAVGQSIGNEEKKREELKKLLEDLRQEVKKNAAKKEIAGMIEDWYRFAMRSLDKSLGGKESMEERVLKEIDYLKFRGAQYDAHHESDQKVKKIQKGTAEEHQWKKTPLPPPKAPFHRTLPPPSLPSPAGTAGARPSV